jgi:hypothetical protein
MGRALCEAAFMRCTSFCHVSSARSVNRIPSFTAVLRKRKGNLISCSMDRGERPGRGRCRTSHLHGRLAVARGLRTQGRLDARGREDDGDPLPGDVHAQAVATQHVLHNARHLACRRCAASTCRSRFPSLPSHGKLLPVVSRTGTDRREAHRRRGPRRAVGAVGRPGPAPKTHHRPT